ncbi:MAG: aminoacyl-tRNA hydrolase [Thermoguttaceae bacterium]|nr:aminoacyl-tRNA hydrolase [Thermoguttaceae bacterium]MDW8038130.1 aminoacyl-tRNA hydrolase [Thermoguttaceae bacterium]
MKLIVGLGNPGTRYAETRHNVGFMVVEQLGRRYGVGSERENFSGLWQEANLEGVRAFLLRPTTYMNCSGLSVQAAVRFYQLPLEEMLVICDDFHLPLGKLRLRPKGSAGGQKGLQNIIQHLGSQEFPRLRIGIGPLPEGADATNFVLSRFSPEEQPIIQEAVRRAADAAVFWAREGIEKTMTQYNRS